MTSNKSIDDNLISLVITVLLQLFVYWQVNAAKLGQSRLLVALGLFMLSMFVFVGLDKVMDHLDLIKK